MSGEAKTCWKPNAKRARAHRLAIEKDMESFHEVFFITAKKNWTGKNSRDLLLKYYPEIKTFAENFSGASAIISYEKAHQMLSYEPTFSVNDLLH